MEVTVHYKKAGKHLTAQVKTQSGVYFEGDVEKFLLEVKASYAWIKDGRQWRAIRRKKVHSKQPSYRWYYIQDINMLPDHIKLMALLME